MSNPTITNSKRVLGLIAVLSTAVIIAGSMLTAQASGQPVITLKKATQVVAGLDTAYALDANGNVFSRGLNNYGQTGTQDSTNKANWSLVSLDKPVQTLSSGYSHVTALTTDNTLYTWGDNQYGTAGNGSTQYITKPTTISAYQNFNKVTSGTNFVTALDSQGRLYVWGPNTDGLLGTGDKNAHPNPTYIATPVAFTQIQAGKDYVLALDTNGHIWSWGNNDNGQLGNGNTKSINVPTQISNLTFKSIATSITSTTSLALDNQGYLWSWGNNDNGQLGNGTDWRLLQQQENARVAAQIAAIKQADADRKANEIQQCITDAQTKWQADQDKKAAEEKAKADKAAASNPKPTATPTATATPNPTASPTASPTATPTPSPTATPAPVMPDYTQQCTDTVNSTFKATDTSNIKPATIPEPALKANGLTPQLVTKAVSFNTVSVGSQNAYGVSTYGNIYSWGSDANGQTGLKISDDKHHTQVPVLAVDGGGYASVTAGDKWATALDKNNNLYTWGAASTGLLITSSTKDNLQPTLVGANYTSVTIGTNTAYATTTNGDLQSWGDGSNSLLGSTNTATKPKPTKIGSGYHSIAVTLESVLALNASGEIFAWGTNNQTFGNGKETNTAQLTPENYPVTKFTQATTGRDSTLALDDNGNIWAWGLDNQHQTGPLGNGSKVTRPVLIPTTSKITQIASSQTENYALTEDNTLIAWGNGNANVTKIALNTKAKQLETTISSAVLLNEDGSLTKIVNGKASSFYAGTKFKKIFPGASATNTMAITEKGKFVTLSNTPATTKEYVPVKGADAFTAGSSSRNFQIALDANGTVWGWGTEPYGVFGTSASSTNPVVLPITNTETK